MENLFNIQEFAAMMNDIAKVETKKAALEAARKSYDEASDAFAQNDKGENLYRYLDASDKRATAERVYKTALTNFLNKYTGERYSVFCHEVRYYNENRPYRIYEIIRNRMMKEATHIEF